MAFCAIFRGMSEFGESAFEQAVRKRWTSKGEPIVPRKALEEIFSAMVELRSQISNKDFRTAFDDAVAYGFGGKFDGKGGINVTYIDWDVPLHHSRLQAQLLLMMQSIVRWTGEHAEAVSNSSLPQIEQKKFFEKRRVLPIISILCAMASNEKPRVLRASSRSAATNSAANSF